MHISENYGEYLSLPQSAPIELRWKQAIMKPGIFKTQRKVGLFSRTVNANSIVNTLGLEEHLDEENHQGPIFVKKKGLDVVSNISGVSDATSAQSMVF